MPTFQSNETVDARQFDGTAESAKELVAWVKTFQPEYRRSTLGVSRTVSMLGSVDPVIEVPTAYLYMQFGREPKNFWSIELTPGAWLVHRQDGRLQGFSPERFQKKYKQV